MPQNFPIKSWAAEDRPREKLLGHGKHALTDAELLAILLRTGNRNESALGLAKRILSSTKGQLSKLAQLSVAELCEFKGMGQAKAIGVVASLELGKRQKIQTHAMQTLSSSKGGFLPYRTPTEQLASRGVLDYLPQSSPQAVGM